MSVAKEERVWRRDNFNGTTRENKRIKKRTIDDNSEGTQKMILKRKWRSEGTAA